MKTSLMRSSSIKAQQGYAMILATFASAVIGMLILGITSIMQEDMHQKYTNLYGKDIARVAQAVQANMSAISTPSTVVEYNGIDFARYDTCGGEPEGILSCNFNFTNGLRLNGDQDDVFTRITVDGAGVATAVITFPVVEQSNGVINRSSTGGVLIAAENYIATHPLPTDHGSIDISVDTSVVPNVIEVQVDTSLSGSAWLQVNGGNTMNANITFSGDNDYDIVNARDVYAERFVDEDDNTYILDADSTSRMSDINSETIATNSISANTVDASSVDVDTTLNMDGAAQITHSNVTSPLEIANNAGSQGIETYDVVLDSIESQYANGTRLSDIIVGQLPVKSAEVATPNSYIDKPSCLKKSAQPQIFTFNISNAGDFKGNGIAQDQSFAEDNGSRWRVRRFIRFTDDTQAYYAPSSMDYAVGVMVMCI